MTKLPISTPAVNNDFIVTDEVEMLLGITSRLMSGGNSSNTLLLGPAGCGKTTAAQQIAAQLGLPYLHINCSQIREAEALFGQREVEAGKTFYKESLFTQVIEAGNALIMLDEINRTAPAALNGLLSVLDGSNPWIESLGRHLKCGSGLVFIGACNIGAAYTGTHRLDKALDDRFGRRLEVSYLNTAQETELLQKVAGLGPMAAGRLVKIAEQVRRDYNAGKTYSTDLSTRVLIAAARDFQAMEEIKTGTGPESLKLTMSNRFSSAGGATSERNSFSMLVDGQFGSWEGE